MEKVREDEESLKFFELLGMHPLDDVIFDAAERFACKMYGDIGSSVNSMRNKLF